MSKRELLAGAFLLLAQVAFAQLRVLPPRAPLDLSATTSLPIPAILALDPADAVAAPLPPSGSIHSIPRAYRYEELALFCRIEVQLERVTKIPVRFRLGSVDYVDYLEGKREVYSPPR